MRSSVDRFSALDNLTSHMNTTSGDHIESLANSADEAMNRILNGVSSKPSSTVNDTLKREEESTSHPPLTSPNTDPQFLSEMPNIGSDSALNGMPQPPSVPPPTANGHPVMANSHSIDDTK